jgi:glycosyltransferase involved in cell wall biosynthesis
VKVLFEELSTLKRLGGIEAATKELGAHLAALGLQVTRSSEGQADNLPDVVHLHGIWSPALAKRFMSWRKREVPCVVSPHGMLEPWALSHKWMKKQFAWRLYQKRLLNRATVLHGTSSRETAQFKSLGLTPPAATIPWGVTVSPKLGHRQSRLRDSNTRVALFVGRIYPVKGLLMLIQAWARIRPGGWKLKIVGPDEAGHRADVEAQVRKAGLQAVVEFAGELAGQAKDTAYEEADLFLLPSFTENFGLAVAEALARSIPVLTTTGTPWSMLPARGCGWCVDPNVEDLSAALTLATSQTADTLGAMGAKGREWMATDFTWPQVAAQMKEVYEWVLGGGPRPDCVVTK